jgi:glucan endo-1,3-alpha-glucosidase
MPSPLSAIKTEQLQYHGCFQDEREKRVLPDFAAYQVASVSECVQMCGERGHTYAGVENGLECWCGGADAKYDALGALNATLCNKSCARTKEECGGEWRLSVYSLKPKAGSS